MKQRIYLLSFLALVACGDLGNAEKKVGNTTKSTDIEKKADNVTRSTHIEKNQDYFKNPYYKEDDIGNKCLDEADTDLVKMRDCTYEQVPRIEKEILKKAKLLNKENVYTSSWIAKKKKVIDRKCTKKYQNQGQIGDIQMASCLTNGMYALGRSMGNVEKKVGNTTQSTDIEKNNTEKQGDNLSEPSQIEKNEAYFKHPFYEEDDIDEKCLHETKGNLVKIRNCTYERVNRIQAEVLKKAKLLSKDNIYSSDWVKKKRIAIEKECNKEYPSRGQTRDVVVAACISEGMYALGRSIK